jgi:DNA polymerase-3 subunit alpha
MTLQNFTDQFESLKIPILGVRLPVFKVEDKYKKELNLDLSTSNKDFLRELCKIGFKTLNLDKKSELYQEYGERIKYELGLFDELGFVDYVLIIWDIINFAKEKNIPTGIGRGSAAGSLVLYLIGVTKIDPLKYGLYFERFISKIRAKKSIVDGITYLDGSLMCDVDLDICYYRRKELLKYINDKYQGKTAKILTFNTLSTKLVIKEVGKIFGMIPEEDMTQVTGMIPKIHGQIEDLDKAYEKVDEFKKWCDENKEVYSIAIKLKDLIKNKSVHASGVMISYYNLDENCPVEFSSDKDIVTSYDMNQVSLFSLKVDVLGLRGVSVIDDVCKMLKIKVEDIDVSDASIYTNLQNLQNPHGLFQIEADLGFKTTQKVKPHNFNELSAILALARPGASQFIDRYAEFTNGGAFQSIHPFFDNILKETGGLCLYQEEAMQMANKVGFTLDEAEQIRRCITGDTLFISKTRGYISINSLLKDGYKDDVFLTMDEIGNQSWQKISNIWSNGTKQTRFVEADNGMEVRASLYHQFLTDSGWKARMRLRKNDYFLSPQKVDYDGIDFINSDLAIVIGGLVTEGYFSGYNATTFTAFDKEMMDIFCVSFKNYFGLFPTYRQCGNVVALKKKQTVEINKILPYGLSASKCLPEKMMGMTKETTRKFLSFILACEGGISQSNTEEARWFEFSSKNKKFCSQVQLLLTRFGIYSKLRGKWNKKYKSFYYHLLIKEYSELVKLNKELTVLWPSIKKQQLDNLLVKERVVNFSFDLIPQTIIKKVVDQYPFATSNKENGFLASGRVYNKPLNRNSFQKLCEGTKNKFWIDYSNNTNFYYNKFSNQKRDTREIEVFDFTMENENAPFIIANGIVIHNCIGKKKVEEIKLWEAKINKKIIENNLDPKIGEVFWKILNDSSGYQFNKSHSFSYAALSAISVFLKFRYPQEFYLSLLKMTKHEQDPIGEISKIHKEMIHFGIKLLPPSLSLSEMDFSIENNNIRFGLSSIKGISDKTMEKLNNFQRKHANKFQMFQCSKESGLNIGQLTSLVHAGALEEFGKNRVLLSYEGQLWNTLTEKEKKLAMNYGEKFEFKLPVLVNAMVKELKDEKSCPLIKLSRFETIKTKMSKYKQIYEQNKECADFVNWALETKLIGYSFSNSLINIFKPFCSSLQQISEVSTELDKTHVCFVGKIEESPVLGKSKKGSQYAKFIIGDETKTIKVMIFSDKMEQCKSINGVLPMANDVVICKGTKISDDTIFADSISCQQNKAYLKFSEWKEDNE